ncbi:serine hydrolase domain-containing protein [Actinoplanes sp. NPDC023801]|uniref:serine hydrolase domain-containing protein n=1 Tax=Actinoplanes sp. NPDC023801 TaxID=3154595 RepID=UPI0033F43178
MAEILDSRLAGPAADVAGRIDQVIDTAIATDRVVGCAVVVARHGEIVHERYAGHADRETGTPVTAGHQFRLASMTKPVVAATALALADRGVLRLDEPVRSWLPWFRPALPDGTRPDLTLRQSLAHTAGLGYGFLSADRDDPYRRAGVSDGGDATTLTLRENLERLASVPLLFEPGRDWTYSLGVDVAGAVIESATGATLGEVVADLITRPLDMTGTGFTADPARLVTAYAGPQHPARVMAADDGITFPGGGPIRLSPGRALDPRAFPSGGFGLVGTARDQLAFLEAVRRGGAPVLTRAAASLMIQDAVPGRDLPVGPGLGFGLGFAVVRDPQAYGTPRPAGSFGWGGFYGTTCFADPVSGWSVVALTNTTPEGIFGAFPAEIEAAVHG